MSITCKQCGTQITQQTVDGPTLLTGCPKCGMLVWVDDQAKEDILANFQWPEMKLPTGVSVERSDEQLIIVRRWFHPKQIGLGIFFGVMILFVFVKIGNDWDRNILCFPPFWVGASLVYYALTKLINATTITVTHNLLTVKHGPLPTWGNKTLDPTQIEQLFAKKVVRRSKKSTRTYYEVRLVTPKNRRQTLVSDLDTPEQALFLEQEIERYLGIRDKPVSGELDQAGKRYVKALQDFADANRLHYFRSKLIEHNRITGDYRGYPVELTVKGKDKAHIQTCITLAANPKVANPAPASTDASQENPLVLTVLDSLLHPTQGRYSAGGRIQVADNGQKVSYKEDNIIASANYLQFLLDALYDLIEAYPKIIALGGQAIPALHPFAEDKSHPAQPVAEALIRQIAPTSHHLCPHTDRLLCVRCLTYCTQHEVNISWLNSVSYCGCRVCHQSTQFYHAPTVVAVLDSQMKKDLIEQETVLRVNWLTRRELFDFKAVEIVQASDEEVERFCVQVGNDTDPIRTSRYAKMRCSVSDQLSPNTMRILRRTFETVEII